MVHFVVKISIVACLESVCFNCAISYLKIKFIGLDSAIQDTLKPLDSYFMKAVSFTWFNYKG